MEEEKIVKTLPDKSRSLRRTSIKKRLETEIKKTGSKTKEKMSKKKTLSKYRRKTANAKERERMKKMNDVFDNLKNVLPAENVDEDGQETKVQIRNMNNKLLKYWLSRFPLLNLPLTILTACNS